MLNGHGDDIYKSNSEIKANFSTNVWYDADTDILRSMLITQIDKIFHYPEPAAESFVREVAQFHNLQPQNVIAGNGATELFYLIAHAFEGRVRRCLYPLQAPTDIRTQKRLSGRPRRPDVYL